MALQLMGGTPMLLETPHGVTINGPRLHRPSVQDGLQTPLGGLEIGLSNLKTP